MARTLYAVKSARTGEFLWAGVVTQETADAVALEYAVRHGNVSLLSGTDLAEELIVQGDLPQEREEKPWLTPCR